MRGIIGRSQFKIRSGSKFRNQWMKIWYWCTWIKTDALCAKELNSWSIFTRKLDHKRVHGRSKKTKNSIQCLKIMGLVQISWFQRYVVSGWICGWNESRIWFSTWNFLYREITTKYVSCENCVIFWFCYIYNFLVHIQNQYI